MIYWKELIGATTHETFWFDNILITLSLSLSSLFRRELHRIAIYIRSKYDIIKKEGVESSSSGLTYWKFRHLVIAVRASSLRFHFRLSAEPNHLYLRKQRRSGGGIDFPFTWKRALEFATTAKRAQQQAERSRLAWKSALDMVNN